MILYQGSRTSGTLFWMHVIISPSRLCFGNSGDQKGGVCLEHGALLYSSPLWFCIPWPTFCGKVYERASQCQTLWMQSHAPAEQKRRRCSTIQTPMSQCATSLSKKKSRYPVRWRVNSTAQGSPMRGRTRIPTMSAARGVRAKTRRLPTHTTRAPSREPTVETTQRFGVHRKKTMGVNPRTEHWPVALRDGVARCAVSRHDGLVIRSSDNQ